MQDTEHTKSSGYQDELNGMNAFHLACISEHADKRIIQILLQNKCKSYATQSCTGNNVLHMIAASKN